MRGMVQSARLLRARQGRLRRLLPTDSAGRGGGGGRGLRGAWSIRGGAKLASGVFTEGRVREGAESID